MSFHHLPQSAEHILSHCAHCFDHFFKHTIPLSNHFTSVSSHEKAQKPKEKISAQFRVLGLKNFEIDQNLKMAKVLNESQHFERNCTVTSKTLSSTLLDVY